MMIFIQLTRKNSKDWEHFGRREKLQLHFWVENFVNNFERGKGDSSFRSCFGSS